MKPIRFFGALCSVAALVSFQFSADAQPVPSATEQAVSASRRAAEYMELLRSNDAALRAVGLDRGLADENLGVRSQTLTAYLRPLSIVHVEVVVEPGGRLAASDTPDLRLMRLQWAEDGRSFTALSGSASGQVTGDRLIVNYRSLVLSGQLLPADGSMRRHATFRRHCEASLSANAARDALEGMMRCEVLQQTFPVRLRFG